MSKPVLYILCGVPFSGKTTLASVLEKKTHSTILSLDEINRERKLGLYGMRIPQEEWDKSYKIAEERLIEYFKNGLSVVYDDTNFLFQKREKLRQIATKWKTLSKTIYINTPISIIQSRIKKNASKKQRHAVHPDDLVFICDTFERPEATENVIEFTFNNEKNIIEKLFLLN